MTSAACFVWDLVEPGSAAGSRFEPAPLVRADADPCSVFSKQPGSPDGSPVRLLAFPLRRARDTSAGTLYLPACPQTQKLPFAPARCNRDDGRRPWLFH